MMRNGRPLGLLNVPVDRISLMSVSEERDINPEEKRRMRRREYLSE